jgi:hypothetical protein
VIGSPDGGFPDVPIPIVGSEVIVPLLARDVAIRLRDDSPIFQEVYKGRDDRPGHGSGREPESNGDGEPFSIEPEIRNDSAPQHNAVDPTA